MFLLLFFLFEKNVKMQFKITAKKKKGNRVMNMILCSRNVGVCLVMRSVFMPSEHLGTIYGLVFFFSVCV